MARMQMLTKEEAERLPAIYSQEDNPDPTVEVKFFDPIGSWTWYVTEAEVYWQGTGDPVWTSLTELIKAGHWNHLEQWIRSRAFQLGTGQVKIMDVKFFGFVDGFKAELGYFCFSELLQVKVGFGLSIERDIHWRPKGLKEVRAKVKQQRGGY